jgi:ABC-type transporter Mla subunit MlaD
MNDYERAAEDISAAIDAVEAINGTDPDIEDDLNEAVEALARAMAKANQRS